MRESNKNGVPKISGENGIEGQKGEIKETTLVPSSPVSDRFKIVLHKKKRGKLSDKSLSRC